MVGGVGASEVSKDEVDGRSENKEHTDGRVTSDEGGTVGVVTALIIIWRRLLHELTHEAELMQDPEKPEISGVQCES